MTGLAVLSDTREYADIITHVDYKMQKENTDFIKLMDKQMDHNFDEESVQKMHGVAAGLLGEKIFNRTELSKVLCLCLSWEQSGHFNYHTFLKVPFA